jgi:hypothetical protein
VQGIEHILLVMSKTLSKKSKLKLYKSVIRPIVTHASEAWARKTQIEEKFLIFERKINLGLLFTQTV